MPPTGNSAVAPCTASWECWQLFGEVGARHADPLLAPLHQIAVDAYLAQHPGERTSDLSIAFALIGLCLALERGRSGPQVRAVHKRLGDARIAWPHLSPLSERGSVTVFDVAASADEEHAAALERWGRSVWDAWAEHRPIVHEWCDRYAAG